MQPSPKIHLPSVIQLLVSGLGLTLFLPVTAGMLVLGVLSLSEGLPPSQETLPLLSLAWTMGISSLLMIPSLVYAIMRLLNKPLPDWKLSNPRRTATRAMLLWPALIGIGLITTRNNALTLVILPPIQIAALGLPLWWLVEMGRSGLKPGTPQRGWGGRQFWADHHLRGHTDRGSPGNWWVWRAGCFMAFNPARINGRTQPHRTTAGLFPDESGSRRTHHHTFSQQARCFVRYYRLHRRDCPHSGRIHQTAGLWGFAGKPLTPAEGFTMGAICGATFALFESLGMFISPGVAEGWGLLILGRTGTGILHTVTSAVMGWGLAAAWSQRKYWSLGASYLIAISLHGIWNLFGILSGFGYADQPGRACVRPAIGCPSQHHRAGRPAGAGDYPAGNFLRLQPPLAGSRSPACSICGRIKPPVSPKFA